MSIPSAPASWFSSSSERFLFSYTLVTLRSLQRSAANAILSFQHRTQHFLIGRAIPSGATHNLKVADCKSMAGYGPKGTTIQIGN